MKSLQISARNLIAVGVLALVAVATAHGQALRANIPFDFEAGGRSFSPGTYKLELVRSGYVQISSAEAVMVKIHIITQLGGGPLSGEAGLVFDNFEGRHVLSEVWIPGQDGVLLHSTPKQHTHEKVIAVIANPSPNMSGKAIFERTCARCHGPSGNGNSAADKFFQVSLPKLNSAYVQSKSDQELKDIISHGRRNMDPVRIGQAQVQHLLSPESVDAVIAYLRTFKQQ